MKAETPYLTLEAIAACHKQGKFAVLNIDHQLMMQRFGTCFLPRDFANYNEDHAHALSVLRAHNVPIIHAAYIFSDAYLNIRLLPHEQPEYKKQRTAYRFNADGITLRRTNKDDDNVVMLDVMNDIAADEPLFPKVSFDAMANKDLVAYALEKKYTMLGAIGCFGSECILQTFTSARKEFQTVAFAEAIEEREPRPLRAKRIQENVHMFAARSPGTFVTTADHFAQAPKI